MKAERPSHHKPVIKEEVSVSNGDDISECLKKLSLVSREEKSKNAYNILVEGPKDVTIKDIKIEKITKNEVKDRKDTERLNSNKSNIKNDCLKKEKINEETEGELRSRGPEQKNGWKTQIRESVLPYSAHPQSNTILTSGGSLYLNRSSSQIPTDAFFPEISTSNHISGLGHDFNIGQDNSLVTNDGNQFTQNIYETSNLADLLVTNGFPQQDTYNSSKSEIPSDVDGNNELMKLINDVVNDPILKQNVLQDYESQALNIAPTLADSHTNIILPEQISPYSPPQVVPKRRPSSYSTSSGSPLGPSSPNLYANTPTFSPNIPSPRGNVYDDSSNHIYPTPAYYSTVLPSPMQRPLSSCSSTSSTNLSYCEPDPIDLNVIYQEPDEEEKKMKLKELTKELDNSCSQVYSKCQYPLGTSQNPSISSVPLINSPVVLLQIAGPTAQSPTLMRSTSNGSQQGSAQRYRKLLPKPSETSASSPNIDPLQTYDVSGRYQSQNRLPQNQRNPYLSAKEQLIQRLRQDKKEKYWARVQTFSDEEITRGDGDGDTPLMILACDKDLSDKAEQLYALVERCRTIPEVFWARNNGGHSALYMACIYSRHDPLLAKYIAEAIMDGKGDLNEVDSKGNTLIHLLCKGGNDFAELIDQLLSLRDSMRKRCFDVNKFDYEGRSPLHLAVETHHRDGPSLDIIKVLLMNGADVLQKDRKQGSTALHFALAASKIDKHLIETLCNLTKLKGDLVNAANYTGDTPLHIAMANGCNVEPQTHYYTVEILMKAGASRAVRNHSGKAPLELAPELRKGELKKILDRYNSK